MAHVDVACVLMASKILKKGNALATRIKLTQINFNPTTMKLAEKVNHLFSHVFMFCNMLLGVTVRRCDCHKLKIFHLPSLIRSGTIE